jgi:hypothetical protein
MAYAVVALVLGGVVGLLAGGSLRNLGEHRLAAWPLLPVGVVLQVAGNLQGGGVGLALVIGSYAALGAFAVANIKLFGMALVVVGLACNLLVITVNDGMPVRPAAAVRAGIASSETALRRIHLKPKHHYERPDDRLMFLGDVLPVPPLHEVLSLGDVIMSLGIAMVIASLLRRDPAHPQPQPTRSVPSDRPSEREPRGQ